MVNEMTINKLLNQKTLFFAALLTLSNSASVMSQETNHPKYWDSQSITSQVSRAKTYTAAMHTRFSDLKSNYELGGVHYYSNDTDTFGFPEALNTEQEMIFCTGADVNFTTAFKRAAASGVISGESVKANQNQWMQGSGNFRVNDDSSTMGFTPSEFDVEVRTALLNNNNSKGRFCYDMNDYANRVDYRNSGAAQATYCDPAASGSSKTYQDPISGYSCRLDLDIPLKVGETRFLRQLQSNTPTIGQGYLGCYKNATTGEPELELIANPDNCTATSRGSCNHTCDWADEVVCTSSTMPRWSGGMCGGVGTTIFKGEAIDVPSSDATSYNSAEGVLYRGTATMRCAVVSGTAQWVVTSQSCSRITQ